MRQLALQLSAQPEATFANFVPGRNAELLAALRALARGHAAERFVCLWGAQGSGRAHLLHAFAHEAAASGRRAADLAAPVAAGALAGLDADAVVAVRGAERLDDAAQVALFGLYNRILDGSGALVVSGAAAPAALDLRPDLATRLAWGLVYEVHPLSDEEKAEAMRARAAQCGFVLPLEAQAYVLRHARRDLPSLLALVDLIDRHSLAAQRAITVPLVREVLRMTQHQAGCAGD
jgi:DnaA family protein